MAPTISRYRQYLRQKWCLKKYHYTVAVLLMRVTPPKVSNAHKQNLYHMKALDEEHVMAPLVFRYRQYLRQKWRLKYAVLRFLCFLCAQLLLGFPTHTNKTYIT